MSFIVVTWFILWTDVRTYGPTSCVKLMTRHIFDQLWCIHDRGRWVTLAQRHVLIICLVIKVILIQFSNLISNVYLYFAGTINEPVIPEDVICQEGFENADCYVQAIGSELTKFIPASELERIRNLYCLFNKVASCEFPFFVKLLIPHNYFNFFAPFWLLLKV